MSLRSLVFGLVLSVAAVAYAPPARAVMNVSTYPKYDVDITYDVSPSWENRACPMVVAFTAIIETKLTAGASHDVTYHWENGKGKRYPDHTVSLDTEVDPTVKPPDLQVSKNQTKFLRYHMTHPFQDSVKLVITKPVHQVASSGSLDILCHG